MPLTYGQAILQVIPDYDPHKTKISERQKAEAVQLMKLSGHLNPGDRVEQPRKPKTVQEFWPFQNLNVVSTVKPISKAYWLSNRVNREKFQDLLKEKQLR